MYTSVIFDLDGTLLDTVADLADATNKVLVDNGFEALPEPNYNHYLGDGVYNLMVRVLDAQPHALRIDQSTYKSRIPELVSLQKEIYSGMWKTKTKPYKNIVNLIEALKTHGAKLGVVSNKPHSFAILMTEHFFGKDAFDIIIGQKEGIPVKPAPDALMNAIEMLSIDKENLLYVGDTNTDMLTAKNAQVKSIGVTWGFRQEEELVKTGADFIVHDALEILDIYK